MWSERFFFLQINLVNNFLLWSVYIIDKVIFIRGYYFITLLIYELQLNFIRIFISFILRNLIRWIRFNILLWIDLEIWEVFFLRMENVIIIYVAISVAELILKKLCTPFCGSRGHYKILRVNSYWTECTLIICF